MPSRLSFEIPPETDRRLRDLLSPRQYEQAAYQAVLRTTNKLKTLVSKRIREQLNLKKSELEDPAKKYLSVQKPTGSPPFEGKIVIRSKRLPYSLFPYSDSRSTGVTIRIAKNRTVTLRHAFEATMPGGHVGIFLRSRHLPSKGPNVGLRTANGELRYRLTPQGIAGRLAITEETTLSLPELVQLDKVWESIQLDTAAEMRKQAESQLQRFLKSDYRPAAAGTPSPDGD